MKKASDNLRDFYELEYQRGNRGDPITPIPKTDDFMYAQVLRQLAPHLKPGIEVLDIGCNNGNLSLFMATEGCNVLGIDIARNAIDLALNSANYYNIHNVKFKSIDFLREWNKAQSFDFVLCSHILEHIPNDAAFLKHIQQSLKPKGVLLLLTPTKYSSFYIVNKSIKGYVQFDKEVGHLRRYTKREISTLIANAGFKINKVVFLDGILRDWFILCKRLRWLNMVWGQPVVRDIFNRVDEQSAKLLFPGSICVHAQKECEN